MKHGANIYKYAARIGCNPEDLIDFSSNINLYQPEINFSLSSKEVAKYPDSEYKVFREFLAQKYAIKKSQIALYGGATSAIYELFASLKRKNVFLYAPLYGEYEKAALKAKKNIYKINRIEDETQPPLEDSIVVFVNPSTPEGTYYENIKELMSSWMELDCTIILDESFLEFEALASMRQEIHNYKRLYIIHSFSKFYSCAGVRVGAIFSHKRNIQKLTSPLWHLSSLDVNFLKQRLSDEDFEKKSRELHKVQKEELLNILTESKLFAEIVESDSNFILTYSANGEVLWEKLLEQKILVRKCASFDYLNNNWLRFAVKDEEAHKALRRALHREKDLYS
ncbi:aminotransferase class I/II-fold pyridoxal phosphate-dependent enzyme [Sulfurimonas sp. SAG-AH-194-L11]|nr:aminotransferase class I/II-fold pyridoxal phosphate-dependent enzyme [Sulfurimonas sp. SAG-AH-194-L11]MDF1876255.1 aminotransferase class I/II-fold pyridoxal phosphate-dependent enzyme [Sulfurimonas sp. SAG-AH-194-L11]